MAIAFGYFWRSFGAARLASTESPIAERKPRSRAQKASNTKSGPGKSAKASPRGSRVSRKSRTRKIQQGQAGRDRVQSGSREPELTRGGLGDQNRRGGVVAFQDQFVAPVVDLEIILREK